MYRERYPVLLLCQIRYLALEHDSCKFMLAIFVHKDNKDLSSQPTTLPPGDSRESARKKRHSSIQEERAIARVARPVDLSVSVERYGDVDHQMKKVRVDGMQFQADKIATNTIVTQIKVMRENADVYKATMGEAKDNEQLVALINKMPGMTPNTPELIWTMCLSLIDPNCGPYTPRMRLL